MLHAPQAIGTVARMWADNTRASFTDSIVKLMLHSERTLCKGYQYIHYDKAFASYHQMARNELVKSMRGEWVFMTDTDHVFRPDTLIRLLNIQKESGAGVVSGIYMSKHPPHGPVANLWTPDNKCVPLLDWDRNANYFPIGPCGGGCLLIMKETLDKLGSEPFNQIGGFSEDYSFFARCRMAGIPTVLAPKIQSNHVIETAIASEDYSPIPGITRAKINEKGEIIPDEPDSTPR